MQVPTSSKAEKGNNAGRGPIRDRHAEKAATAWIRFQTLPALHPLAKLRIKPTQRFNSPLSRLSTKFAGTTSSRVEKIEPYSIQPWLARLRADTTKEEKSKQASIDSLQGIVVATSASDRNGKVGAGGAIKDTESGAAVGHYVTYLVKLESRKEQNPYTGELTAISLALRCLPDHIQGRNIYITTRSLSTAQVLMKPKQQSGQADIIGIYRAAEKLLQRENRIQLIWLPRKVTSQQQAEAKKAARKLTTEEVPLEPAPYQARSTTIRRVIEALKLSRTLPGETGNFTAKLDKALPGKHTKKLYENLKKTEANILIQLRTAMDRINEYLYRIGAAESPICACGVEKEDVKHFLIRCSRWATERTPLHQYLIARENALSLCLGGKAPSDPNDWSPNMTAVKATLKFALATGRLDYQHRP